MSRKKTQQRVVRGAKNTLPSTQPDGDKHRANADDMRTALNRFDQSLEQLENDLSRMHADLEQVHQQNQKTEGFRTKAAIFLGIAVFMLAVANQSANNLSQKTQMTRRMADETWQFYFAKSIRQISFRTSVDLMGILSEMEAVSPSIKEATREKVEQYRSTVARYEDEPDSANPDNPIAGEGKKQLVARARHFESMAEEAENQEESFKRIELLLQIAIFLASTAIAATSRLALRLSVVITLIATLLMGVIWAGWNIV